MGRKHTIREMAWTIRLILLSIVRGGTDTRVKADPAEPGPIRSIWRRGRRLPGFDKLTVFDDSKGTLLPWHGHCGSRFVFSRSS